jgi:hypothetical protein
MSFVPDGMAPVCEICKKQYILDEKNVWNHTCTSNTRFAFANNRDERFIMGVDPGSYTIQPVGEKPIQPVEEKPTRPARKGRIKA